MRWACDCPLCRALVHPVFKRLSSPGASEEPRDQGALEEVKEPLLAQAAAKVIGQAGGQPPEGDKAQAGQTGEPAWAPPTHQVVEVTVPKEVVERISELEEEMKRLRSELSAISEGLKSAVIEFREAIAEMSSPFGALRRNGDGKDKADGRSRMAPSTFVELLRVVESMLGEMDKDTVLMLLSSYVKAGIISEPLGLSPAEIVELAHTMKSRGISVDKQLPYLYELARALKIDDQSLAAMLLRQVIRRGGLG